ncbi:MAG TPA: signal peptidase I [Sphingomonas sp.]|jgi:signal peptidase I
MATIRSKKPAPQGWLAETTDTLRFLAKLAIIVWLFRSLVFSAFSIPSESMLPRLMVGDYLFVSKWNYGYSRWSFPWGQPAIPGKLLSRVPARGDVVVFRAPVVLDHDVIKRVIGLPGDTVQMRRGQLVLNGVAIPKQRVGDLVLPLSPNYDATKCGAASIDVIAGQQVCRYRRFSETLPGGRTYDVLDQDDIPEADDTGVYTVPDGHVFLMGDNRDRSADSRFPAPDGMGFVPLANIEGKAVVSFFSTDGSAEWIKPWTWFTAARWSRIGEGF